MASIRSAPRRQISSRVRASSWRASSSGTTLSIGVLLSPASPRRQLRSAFDRRVRHAYHQVPHPQLPFIPLSADWAAQRIKGLSLTTTIRNALLGSRKPVVKTLIDRFHYPERGPG